jgi:hypothetical protein
MRMVMENLPITLGLEFESIINSKEEMSRIYDLGHVPNSTIRAVTRDASVESETAKVGNSTVFLGSKVLRTSLGRRERCVTGYELITYPLEMDVMRRVIDQTINTQVRLGEIYSDRSSIHVHAGYPCGLIFAKTAVALGLKVEPLLYKIAGMGRKFRGLSNNAAYCRPLGLPPAVKLQDSKQFAVLSPLDAIDADGPEQFWGKFGIRYGDRERYNPLRYMGVNVFSTLLRGTMEFRFFNFCTVSRYVEAVTGLCQFISDLMIRIPLDVANSITPLSIFKDNSNQLYRGILFELLEVGKYYNSEFPMAEEDIANILELIEVTPQPVFTEKTVQSHINTPRICKSDAIRFGLKIVENALPAGIVDIHTFGDTERKLLGDACAN